MRNDGFWVDCEVKVMGSFDFSIWKSGRFLRGGNGFR